MSNTRKIIITFTGDDSDDVDKLEDILFNLVNLDNLPEGTEISDIDIDRDPI